MNKEKFDSEMLKANDALKENNQTVALIHLYAATIYASEESKPFLIEKTDLEDDPEVQKDPDSENKVSEGKSSFIDVKIGLDTAKMVFQPIRGDDRYRYHKGDGARFTLTMNPTTVGCVGKSHSVKFKHHSPYLRHKEIHVFLHKVFGIEENDPRYKKASIIISTAMTKAETKFMKGMTENAV